MPVREQNIEDLENWVFYFDSMNLIWHAVYKVDYESKLKDNSIHVDTVFASNISTVIEYILSFKQDVN